MSTINKTTDSNTFESMHDLPTNDSKPNNSYFRVFEFLSQQPCLIPFTPFNLLATLVKSTALSAIAKFNKVRVESSKIERRFTSTKSTLSTREVRVETSFSWEHLSKIGYVVRLLKYNQLQFYPTICWLS